MCGPQLQFTIFYQVFQNTNKPKTCDFIILHHHKHNNPKKKNSSHIESHIYIIVVYHISN